MLDFDPFECQYMVDILIQKMIVSINVTWLNIAKCIERPLKLYTDVS